MRKQKGFSLIELLIVVAIILIIAAIAIPNLLRSRMAANEASAVGSLRTINTAKSPTPRPIPIMVSLTWRFLDWAWAPNTSAARNALLDPVLGCANGGAAGAAAAELRARRADTICTPSLLLARVPRLTGSAPIVRVRIPSLLARLGSATSSPILLA